MRACQVKSRPPFIALYRKRLTNIARHAQAKSASILVEKHDETVRAIVEDDGVGFDISTNQGERHLGLLGMRERAELLGGTLTIESTSRTRHKYFYRDTPFHSTCNH
jgi:nitrate/nitrite-specific signal transduction histidine kinase